ncbi:MAG TPA: hypothetical protein VGF40_13035 [Thermoanaerobaculia bacterium]
MARRVISGFVISPAVVPLGVTARALVDDVGLQESVIIGSIYAAFTYGAAIVMGIPAFYAFSRKGWTRWWQYALAGAAIGIAVLAGASAAAGESFFRLPIALLLIAMGVVSTTVFWSVAIATWTRRHGPAGA